MTSQLASGATLPPVGSEEAFVDPNNAGQRFPFPSLFGEAELDLSVIVPAYNEVDRLPAMMDECVPFLVDRKQRFEIIVVDDGSRDATADLALSYTKKYGSDMVRVLRLQKNSGKGAAVRKGMLRARGNYLLMADADAATRFSDLLDLMDGLRSVEENELGIAVGSRYQATSKATRSFARKLVSKVFNLVVEYVGGVRGISDTQCGFKVYTRKAAQATFSEQHLDRWAFDVENLYLAQRAKIPIIEVPVQWSEVPGSKLSVVKATINMFRDIVLMRFRYLTGQWKPAVAMRSVGNKIK
eukprot:Plantae.Rhodophyta-Rhodochaete_pulchella.ctg7989.p1 GENE.Plantae.Rhodophyta-Rhodochaete_pulchella.ctg7989~~Plantae.Rhodophyta-Rhodochaete_pulchella.ctg7989.p1  ORF type:complete len:298 (+),score=49.46 Plantae.Rhodophyta-Rhodochaete_pulchella.ctg7989:129-1022(+)